MRKLLTFMVTKTDEKSADVWSQPDCNWCAKVKMELEAANIPVVEHDITKELDDKQRKSFKDRYGTVPVVVFNQRVIGGYAETHMALRALTRA